MKRKITDVRIIQESHLQNSFGFILLYYRCIHSNYLLGNGQYVYSQTYN